jgi:hypothetical protein
MTLTQEDRGGLDLVGGEDACSDAGHLGAKDAQIQGVVAAGLNASVNGAGEEPLGRCNCTARDNLYFHR